MATRERRFGKLLTADNTNVHQQVTQNAGKLSKRSNETSSPKDAHKRPKSVHHQPENEVPSGKTGTSGKDQCKNEVKAVVESKAAVESKPRTSRGDPTKVIESHVRRLDLEDTKCKNVSPASNSMLQSPPVQRVTRSSSLRISTRSSITVDPNLVKLRATIDFSDPTTYYTPPAGLPDNVADFDKSQLLDVNSEPHYAHEVFMYYKAKESKHIIPKYMNCQTHINPNMRCVLVDWMVEVQESFELNHETLYLAVKLMDHYLSKKIVNKNKFQLLGATCLFVAAKYDERIPPAIDDFLYICDDAYQKRDFIVMEIDVLKRVNFFLGFPLSYRFLRRIARCSGVPMETLTLARYILETSLMEYDLIFEKDSKMAAAALILALKMKSLSWEPSHVFYSGYKEDDLLELMYKLNNLISPPFKSSVKTIRSKYSHSVFYEVAKLTPLSQVTMRTRDSGRDSLTKALSTH